MMTFAIGMASPWGVHRLGSDLGKRCGTSDSGNQSIGLRVSNYGSDYVQRHVTTSAPRLGRRWREYQGSNNWEGLLDPLHDDLRREILRYGQFVEAAYRSFNFDFSSPDYATCRFSGSSLLTGCGLGSSGYRVTKNLRATCGVELPCWIRRAPRWMSTPSSWIGYVAVCSDSEEIDRLGRRDVVIAYRGTGTCLEWLENLRAPLTSLGTDMGGSDEPDPMVESGFLSMYTSGAAKCPSLRDTVRKEIARIIQLYGDEPLSLTIVGHSLGAALATLTAYDIATTFEHAPMVSVVSFGGPRVGNSEFRCQLDKSGAKILRIVNSDDVVTKVPGFVLSDGDVAARRALHVSVLPRWLQKEHWVYADVGRELRLSSRESKHLGKPNFATCHDLKTYLHLVNGFVSSTCPFRARSERVPGRRHREKHLRTVQKPAVNHWACP